MHESQPLHSEVDGELFKRVVGIRVYKLTWNMIHVQGAVSGIKGTEISSKELLSSLVGYPATFEQPHPHTPEVIPLQLVSVSDRSKQLGALSEKKMHGDAINILLEHCYSNNAI